MTAAERFRVETAIQALAIIKADLEDIKLMEAATETAVRVCCSAHSLLDWLNAKRSPN